MPAPVVVKPMGTLSITGFVTPSGSTRVEPVFCVDAQPVTPALGPHKLYLVDAQQKQLASYAFDGELRAPKDVARPTDPKYFSLLVPAIDFSELVFEPQGAPPVRKAVSPNAPSVKLDPITEASFLPGNKLRISWTVNDIDREPLFVRLETSADDGATWREVFGLFEEQRSLDIDVRWIKATNAARVRATVSDGLRCGRDEVGPFVVPKRPPVARIRRTFRPELAGDATLDLHVDVGSENGAIDDAKIVWRSSLDGELGHGKLLKVSAKDRSAGKHAISVSVTDAAGLSSTDEVQLDVAKK